MLVEKNMTQKNNAKIGEKDEKRKRTDKKLSVLFRENLIF